MEKNSVLNRRMIISVLLATSILGHAYLKYAVTLHGQNDVLYLITLPMATSMFSTFAAIFPALPYSLSFTEDYNTSFFRFIIIRSGRKKYVLKRIVSISMSGAVMMSLAFGIIFSIALIFGVPTTNENVSDFYKPGIWYPLASVWGGKLVLLLKIILAFLFGTVWSNVCLLLSLLSLNRYVAFIGTFILYQFLWQFLASAKWNPVYLLRADLGAYRCFGEPILIQLFIWFLLFIVNYHGMMRRLKNV